MLTDLTGVATGYQVASQVGVVHGSSNSSELAGKAGVMAQVDAAKEFNDPAQLAVGAYAALRIRQDELNDVASVVREVNSATNKAEQLLDSMENGLRTVVKMYPPYPLDNPDRISLLNNFGGLRKQIDALSFPAPEELDAIGRLADKQSHNEVTGGGREVAEPRHDDVQQPLWDIAVLDATGSSDEEVGKAYDQVMAAKVAVQDMQDRIWKDVESFVKRLGLPEAISAAEEVRDRLAKLDGLGIGIYSGQMAQSSES